MFHPKRTTVLVALSVVTAGLMLSGCADSGSGTGDSTGSAPTPGVTDTEIHLGTSNGVTGPSSAACGESGKGQLAYFDKVNADGGVNGRKIVDDLRDDANEAPKAVANANAFIEDQVLAVVGGCGSAAGIAIVPLLDEAKIPYIAPNVPVQSMYDPTLENTFAIFPSYKAQLELTAEASIKEFDSKTSVIVVNELPDWESTITDVAKVSESAGAKVQGTLHAALATADYTALAVQVKEWAPDALLLSMGVSDAAKFLNALDAQGFMPDVIATTGTTSSEVFVEPGGYLASGHLRMASAIAVPGSDEAAECTKVLEDAGIAVGQYALLGCAQAQVIVEALNRAGKDLSRESLVATLNNNFKDVEVGTFPTISFSADDHLGLQSMYVVDIKNNKLVLAGDPIAFK